MQLHFSGVQLRHLSGFADQAVQAVAFFVDDGQQLGFSGGERLGLLSSDVTDALMAVSGVRNSWVTESRRSERNCSLSRAASARLSFSIAPARSTEMAIRLPIASRVWRDSSGPAIPCCRLRACPWSGREGPLIRVINAWFAPQAA